MARLQLGSEVLSLSSPREHSTTLWFKSRRGREGPSAKSSAAFLKFAFPKRGAANSCEAGRCLPKSGQTQLTSPQIGTSSAHIVRNQPNSGRNRLTWGKIRPTSTSIGTNSDMVRPGGGASGWGSPMADAKSDQTDLGPKTKNGSDLDDAIRRIVSGTVKSAPQPKTPPERRNII